MVADPSSPSPSSKASVQPAWVIAAIVVALLLGFGGYLVGKNGGEDLGQARALGEASGEEQGRHLGHRRGFKSGFRAGARQGFAAAFAPAYKAAYVGAIEEAGLEAPAPRDIKVVDP